MIDRAADRKFFVVVPFYNEEKGMLATLEALGAQSDRNFSLVLVDNASTDGSAALAKRFSRRDNDFATYCVNEPTKGTGVAADTGFRFAIARGAKWIARTDADCLPDVNWVRYLRKALCDEGLEFVAGRIVPRQDEWPLTRRWRLTLALTLWIAENFGKINRWGSHFRYPYFMAAGSNLAISASLYERCGGFPRTSLEDLNEDDALAEAVRRITTRAARRHEIIVQNSSRRLRTYGVVNTLRWYRNRGYRPDVVDVR